MTSLLRNRHGSDPARALELQRARELFVVVGLTQGAAVDDVCTVRTDGTGLRRLTHDLDAYSASWR
ncbi:MAG TPA: hypothetical protein VLD16_02235 [Gaiellaceae bacterium]|nr:hypothetical protein [Gaiellaceae bacterium]